MAPGTTNEELPPAAFHDTNELSQSENTEDDDISIASKLASIQDLQFYRLHPDKVHDWAEELYLLGRSKGDEALVAKSGIFLAAAYLDRLQYAEARALLTASAEYYRREGQRQLESAAHRYLGTLEDISQNYERSEEHYRHSLELGEKEKNRDLQAATLFGYTGMIMRAFGPARALYYCERTIEVSSSEDLTRTLTFSLHTLSEIGKHLDRQDLIERGSVLYDAMQEKVTRYSAASVFDHILNAERATVDGKYELALYYYQEAEPQLQAYKIAVTLAESYVSQGILLVLLGRREEGLVRIRDGVAAAEHTQNERAIQAVHFKIANAYAIMGDYQQSAEILKMLSARLKVHPFATLQAEVLDLQLQCYEKLHRYKEALEISKEIMQHRQQIFSIGDYHRYYTSKVVEGYEKKVQGLLYEVAQAERQVSEIAREVLRTPDLRAEQRTYLNQVLQKHHRDIGSSDDLPGKEVIEEQLLLLRKHYPALTKMELKVCSFILSGQTTLQIAAKLKLSDRTIDAHRRNLRKKLQIKPTEDLQQGIIRLLKQGNKTPLPGT